MHTVGTQPVRTSDGHLSGGPLGCTTDFVRDGTGPRGNTTDLHILAASRRGGAAEVGFLGAERATIPAFGPSLEPRFRGSAEAAAGRSSTAAAGAPPAVGYGPVRGSERGDGRLGR